MNAAMDALPSALWHEPASMSAPRYSPRATLRLQFHRCFTLDGAVRIVDHTSINPELGGEAALRRLVAALRAHGMGLILDIAPNHMVHPGRASPGRASRGSDPIRPGLRQRWPHAAAA
jgi:Alpha amylase, catalytic domain